MKWCNISYKCNVDFDCLIKEWNINSRSYNFFSDFWVALHLLQVLSILKTEFTNKVMQRTCKNSKYSIFSTENQSEQRKHQPFFQRSCKSVCPCKQGQWPISSSLFWLLRRMVKKADSFQAIEFLNSIHRVTRDHCDQRVGDRNRD